MSCEPPVNADRRARTGAVLFWVGCALTLIYSWSVYVPLIEKYPYNLTIDWMAALNVARVKHLQFGRDIIFTYGPLGFAWIGYHRATFHLLITFWSVVQIALWLAIVLGLRAVKAPRSIILLTLLAFFVLSSGEHSSMHDARLLVLSFVLLAYHFRLDDRPLSLGKTLLIVALALSGLAKFTYLIAAVLACCAISADEWTRRRRPYSLTLLVACYLLGWVLLDQSLANLPHYLRMSWIVAREYEQAMAIVRDSELTDACIYLVPALLLFGLVLAEKQKFFSRRLFHGGALGFLLLLIFKAGYVRHDEHEILSTSILPPVVAIYILSNFRRFALNVRTFGWALCFVASIYAAASSTQIFDRQSFIKRTVRSNGMMIEELRDASRIIAGHPPETAGQYEDIRDLLARMQPLPKVDGTCDFFLNSIFRVVSNGLDYSPRPALQGYAAYAPALAEADAEFLRSDRAPKNLFVNIENVDGRFPAMNDGRALLEIISRYQFVHQIDDCAQLRRSPVSTPFTLTPLSSTRAGFMEPISIGAAPRDIIWAEIDIKPTIVGRLGFALYKPPILVLDILTSDGEQISRRFVPGAGRSGFIISPVILTSRNLASLCNPQLKSDGLMPETESFRIGTMSAQAPSWGYEPQFEVKLFRVDRVER